MTLSMINHIHPEKKKTFSGSHNQEVLTEICCVTERNDLILDSEVSVCTVGSGELVLGVPKLQLKTNKRSFKEAGLWEIKVCNSFPRPSHQSVCIILHVGRDVLTSHNNLDIKNIPNCTENKNRKSAATGKWMECGRDVHWIEADLFLSSE